MPVSQFMNARQSAAVKDEADLSFHFRNLSQIQMTLEHLRYRGFFSKPNDENLTQKRDFSPCISELNRDLCGMQNDYTILLMALGWIVMMLLFVGVILWVATFIRAKSKPQKNS